SHTVTEGSRGMRLRELLIGMEVALGATLLIVAGLLANSFVRLLNVDKGFETQSVLTVDLALPSTKYSKETQRDQFFQQLLARMHTISGVRSVGFITALPARGETWLDPLAAEGDVRPALERPIANQRWISPDYFKSLGIPIRRGRAFEESDRGKTVGILSEKTAQRLWPGQDPIGKRFLGGDEKLYTLIAVAGDTRASLHQEPSLMAYYPYWQRAPASIALVVRAASDPRALAGAVRAAVRDADPEVPIQEMKTMEQVVAASVAQRRFQMELLLLFAVSALSVASLGIYGVVSYSVTQRRN